MKPTRILAGMAAILLSLSVPALAQEPLRVGAYPANPPWENKTESGAFEGFEVDIVNEIARRMGTTAEFQGMDFKALFVASASRRADMVISSLTITDERLANQSFTQPYFQGALGIGVREDSDLAGVEGLAGKTVGSVATSFGEAWLKENAGTLGQAGTKSYDSTANMLTDLQNGRIDAAVNDIVGMRYAFTQMQGLKVGAEVTTGEKFAMMLPKGSEHLDQVNQIISDMKTDGTMAALHEKWLGVAPAADSFAVTPMPVPAAGE